MSKKLIGAFMALAAFAAFAVMPAVSSASPELTHPTSMTMPAGKGCPTSCIKATLTGGNALFVDTTTPTPNTLVTCNASTLTGELTQNNGTSVQGKITSAIYGGSGTLKSGEPATECTSSFGNISVTALVSAESPWCLKSTGGGTDNFSVTGGGCPGGEALKFILNSTTVGECEYETAKDGSGNLIPVTGTFTTDTSGSDAVLTVTGSGFTKIRGGFLCPPSGKLQQSFTLETDAATAEPVYIS